MNILLTAFFCSAFIYEYDVDYGDHKWVEDYIGNNKVESIEALLYTNDEYNITSMNAQLQEIKGNIRMMLYNMNIIHMHSCACILFLLIFILMDSCINCIFKKRSQNTPITAVVADPIHNQKIDI